MSEYDPALTPWIERLRVVRRRKSLYRQSMDVYEILLQLHQEPGEVAREVLLWMLDEMPRYSFGEDAEPLRELERRGDLGAVPALSERVESGRSGGRTLAALQALASGARCSCAVHKAMGDQPGPNMQQEGEEVDATLWQRTTWGRCQLCGVPWKLRRQDQDRGPSESSWLA